MEIPASKKKMFYLENYLDLLQSRDFSNFTADHLNKIVKIHGFKKLGPKKETQDAVRGLELINPVRSTLNEEISASSMTLNDTVKDLKALNWPETLINSITDIKGENYGLLPNPTSTKATTPSSQKVTKRSNIASFKSGPKKSDVSVRVPKRPKFASLISISSASGPSNSTSSGSSSIA
ncbi:unnamed protein product [Amaranthus hypochondriacus]